ncbi:hypothetical protein MEO_06062 [Candida albicans P94015]|nr:hypothetical protein MEO_06062 [Candida albicans P94015]
MLCSSNNNKEKKKPSIFTPKTKRGEIGTTNKILESIARRGTTQYNTCAI